PVVGRTPISRGCLRAGAGSGTHSPRPAGNRPQRRGLWNARPRRPPYRHRRFSLTIKHLAATYGQKAGALMTQQLRLGAIVFSVRDIERTQQFYRDVLGLKTDLRVDRYDEDHPEQKMLRADLNGTPLIFFERDEKPGKSPVVVFGL